MINYAITGSDGKLGRYLVEKLEFLNSNLDPGIVQVEAFNRQKLDFSTCTTLEIEKQFKGKDVVIHCAAYTDVVNSNTEDGRLECFNSNVLALNRILDSLEKNVLFVYISTDYINAGDTTYYTESKRIAENLIEKYHPNHLIIRTSFKPRNFWGEDTNTGVFHPVFTNADWLDIIGDLIFGAVCETYANYSSQYRVNDFVLPRNINIGTERKTLKSLAESAYPQVKIIDVADADRPGHIYPRDTSVKDLWSPS